MANVRSNEGLTTNARSWFAGCPVRRTTVPRTSVLARSAAGRGGSPPSARSARPEFLSHPLRRLCPMAAVIAAPHRRTVHAPELSPPSPARPPLQVIPGGRRAARAHARTPAPGRSAAPGRLPAPSARRRSSPRSPSWPSATSPSPGSARCCPPTAPVLPLPGPRPMPRHRRPRWRQPGRAAPAVYVVQPGDTLWSIARQLRPSGDIRPLVDALADRAGSGPLVAGQALPVDGLVD